MTSDHNPLFPHPISLILLSVSMFLLTLLSQIIEPVKYQQKWLIQRIMLSAIPPLLGTILSIKFYKEEKIKQRDQIFLIMSIIITAIMSFLTLAYGLLLLLLYVGSTISNLSLYFLSVGIWGLIGITLGDSSLFYTSEINISLDENTSRMQKFTQRSSQNITRILSTSRNRIFFLLVSLSIFLLAIVVVSYFGNAPISF